MQRQPSTIRTAPIRREMAKVRATKAGQRRLKSHSLGIFFMLALTLAPAAAYAWTPWGAIARLFSGGNALRQVDGATALKAVCQQANDDVLSALATGHGFSSGSSDRLDISAVFAGSASLALAFGGGENGADVQRDLELAAEAAMPSVHALLAKGIAEYDFGDPLGVLRSEPGAATRILAVRWRPGVKGLFLTRMTTSLENSTPWARTAAALDRVGPGRMSRGTQRAVLDAASDRATEAVFRRLAEREAALRAQPDLVLSPRARAVLNRMAHQSGPRGR